MMLFLRAITHWFHAPQTPLSRYLQSFLNIISLFATVFDTHLYTFSLRCLFFWKFLLDIRYGMAYLRDLVSGHFVGTLIMSLALLQLTKM